MPHDGIVVERDRTMAYLSLIPTHSFGTGRVCTTLKCGTVLSRYNPGPDCYCCTRTRKRAERAQRYGHTGVAA